MRNHVPRNFAEYDFSGLLVIWHFLDRRKPLIGDNWGEKLLCQHKNTHASLGLQSVYEKSLDFLGNSDPQFRDLDRQGIRLDQIRVFSLSSSFLLLGIGGLHKHPSPVFAKCAVTVPLYLCQQLASHPGCRHGRSTFGSGAHTETRGDSLYFRVRRCRVFSMRQWSLSTMNSKFGPTRWQPSSG